MRCEDSGAKGLGTEHSYIVGGLRNRVNLP